MRPRSTSLEDLHARTLQFIDTSTTSSRSRRFRPSYPRQAWRQYARRMPALDARSELNEFGASVRERLRPFFMEEVNPGADERDGKDLRIPSALMQRAAELGLFGQSLPKELGGQALDLMHWARTLEQVGYLSDDTSFSTLLSLRVAIAHAIWSTGRADLIERYARPMARGELRGALAYSDSADAFSFRSIARKEGSGYILNGEKFLVTGGSDADVFMTYLKEESGDLIVVLIERTDGGVTTEPVPVTGLRSMGLSNFKFKDTVVSAERVMVAHDGLSHAQRFLNSRRALLVCGPLGGMEAIIELCITSLEGVVRYRMPVLEMPNVQATLGQMFVHLETSRAILYRALEHVAHSKDYNSLFDPLVSAAKYYVAERSVNVCHAAFRLLGGKGYTRAFKVERFLRDAYGLMAGGGAQDILEIQLGEYAVSKVHTSNFRGKK